ncbi:helix-turn-helix domain-containing protein [Parabacteroides sp. FAFU027]|uniref:helix-turn-helix domain-containing protein n=1 Tax=Parabacteroides sp. FAFU027 TaxID=2922715 RepID=UPI00293E2723|nr:helix-turn-helix domain-containing protein [Parabacteroides sp. FAFU027]
MQTSTNPQLDLAYNFVQYTHRNIYLTGKAGTGKTTFLRTLKASSLKRMVVVAPTGVAAINAGGVTIHSFFQLPFGPMIPKDANAPFVQEQGGFSASNFRMSREKIRIIRSLDLLVIDEISMVRADLLDGIDEVLRRHRRNSLPFGGVQLLMIGDMQQLPPVVKQEDLELLRPYYRSLFFFESLALKKTSFVPIELKHIYRQSNENFISILNKIRDNKLDREALNELNARFIPNFKPASEEGCITLTTHNRQAQEINESKLNDIKLQKHLFRATIEGDFPEYSYPTEKELELKVGAQVMFVKNDSSRDKLYFNGKIGIVTNFDDDGVCVKCEDWFEPVIIGREKWDNLKYTLNETTKEIDESSIGSFTQYPLKLAWAITIHKSQGLTFEKAIIYAGAAFAHGQTYVALSRCKSLEGLVLGTPISADSVISDHEVTDFNHNIDQNAPNDAQLDQSKRDYQLELLLDLFDYQPVLRNLYAYQKQAKEHVTILPDGLAKSVTEIIESIKNNAVTVAEKFAIQLQQLIAVNPDIEGNAPLQERIRKASAYYLDLTEKLVGEVKSNCIVEIDNKAVQKALDEPLERIFADIRVKEVCLNACLTGFNFRDYLSLRAKALIEEPQRKKTTPKIQLNEDNALVKYLREWRKDKAEEFGLDLYMILSQKSLAELATVMPTSMKELKAIHGIGPQKLKQFGEEILNIILQYRQANNIQTTVSADNFKIEEKTKAPKIDTKKVSFDLFKSGKSVEEIAQERTLTPNTIEGHLAHYISTGEIRIDELLDRNKAQQIIDQFHKLETTSMTPVKEALGDDVSYGEIRLVVAHMRFEGGVE